MLSSNDDGSEWVSVWQQVLCATVGSCRGIGCIWYCVNVVGDSSLALEGHLNGCLVLLLLWGMIHARILALLLCMYYSPLTFKEYSNLIETTNDGIVFKRPNFFGVQIFCSNIAFTIRLKRIRITNCFSSRLLSWLCIVDFNHCWRILVRDKVLLFYLIVGLIRSLYCLRRNAKR